MQFITGVGGVAGGLFALGTGALIVQSIRAGQFGLALQLLPMFLLSVGDLVALYGLARLRRWGYVWTRRLFGLTLVVNLPAAVAGNPLDVGTVAFCGVTLTYLWLAEPSTFRRGVPADAGDGDGPDDLSHPDDEPVDVEIGEPGDEPPVDADPLGASGDESGDDGGTTGRPDDADGRDEDDEDASDTEAVGEHVDDDPDDGTDDEDDGRE